MHHLSESESREWQYEAELLRQELIDAYNQIERLELTLAHTNKELTRARKECARARKECALAREECALAREELAHTNKELTTNEAEFNKMADLIGDYINH